MAEFELMKNTRYRGFLSSMEGPVHIGLDKTNS